MRPVFFSCPFFLRSKREFSRIKDVSEIALGSNNVANRTLTACRSVATRATENRDGQVKEWDPKGGERHAYPWDLRIST